MFVCAFIQYFTFIYETQLRLVYHARALSQVDTTWKKTCRFLLRYVTPSVRPMSIAQAS